jgi:hypothetical protein
MSNQLQITGGAKVRSLEGVITGTSGVLGSLPINASNGIPQLDINGKILVSQLPNSVMEYKGTWDASTNTPTLANGTGNQGDVYLCNVAGTVNFGAGPIQFFVGDQVIYSGTIWQRASGASGTVTSVGISTTAPALTITNSPITTSGNIGVNFSGNSGQYVSGDGNLVTFPTIITQAQNLVTEVYNETGATLTKGTVVYINGGHGNLPTITKALATSDATSAQTYGVVRADISNNNNGYVTVIGNLDNMDTQAYAAGTQLYLSSTTAGAYTSVKQYAPAHLVYVGIVTRSHPTQGVIEIKIQNGFEMDELHNVSAQSPSNNDGLFYNSSNSLWENKSIATALGYTPANAALVVPYTGATANVNLGLYAITSDAARVIGDNSTYGGVFSIRQSNVIGGLLGSGYTELIAKTNKLGISVATGALSYLDLSLLTTDRTYTFPDISGTFALLEGTQTFSGDKTFNGGVDFNNALNINNTFNLRNNLVGSTLYTNFSILKSGSLETLSLLFSTANSSKLVFNDAANYTYTFPTTSGTLALSSDLSSYVPYTGATTSLVLGSNDLLTRRVYLTTNNEGIWAKNFSGTNQYQILVLNASDKISIDQNGLGTIFGGNVDLGSNFLKARTFYSEGNGGGGSYAIKNGTTPSFEDGYTVLSSNDYRLNIVSTVSAATKAVYFGFSGVTATRTFTLPDASGTLALTSDLSSYVPYTGATGNVDLGTRNITSNGIKSGIGILLSHAAQYGSVSGYTAINGVSTGIQIVASATTTANLIFPASTYSYTYPASTGTLVLGTGTTNYLPKFTGASTIGNSLIWDNGTNVGIGNTNTTYTLDVTGTGRFTGTLQLGASSSTWGLSSFNAMFFGDTGGFYGGSGQMALTNNATHNGTNWIYRTNNYGALLTTDSGAFQFQTAAIGTAGNTISWINRMIINTSGNVGIGTSSPSGQLHLKGASGVTGFGDEILQIESSTSNYSGVVFSGTSGFNAAIRTEGASTMTFWTAASNTFTERMRLNSSQGLVMADGMQVLTTGGYYRLRTSAGATTGLFIQRNTWTGSGDASPAIAAETGYGIYTYTNGSVSPAGPYVASGGTSWTNGSSDVRKKKNFETTQGLEEILQVEPVKYHFLEDDDNSKKRLGFKAQNILDIIPEMVSETGEIAEDGTPYLTVTPDYILPVLVKAIQELNAKVSALENNS